MWIRIRLIALMRTLILIFIWCGSISDFSPLCGSGSRFLLPNECSNPGKSSQIGSYSIRVGLSSANWCRSGSGSGSSYHFDADPDPDFYLMRIRILIFIWCWYGSGCGYRLPQWSGSGSTRLRFIVISWLILQAPASLEPAELAKRDTLWPGPGGPG